MAHTRYRYTKWFFLALKVNSDSVFVWTDRTQKSKFNLANKWYGIKTREMPSTYNLPACHTQIWPWWNPCWHICHHLSPGDCVRNISHCMGDISDTGNIEDLQRTQKTFAKLVLKAKYKTYKNALRVLDIDSLEMRRKEICVQFAKHWIKNNTLNDLFNEKTHGMKTRDNNKYKVKFAKVLYQCKPTEWRCKNYHLVKL